MSEPGNMMQRLYDAMPPYPYTVTAYSLRVAFPHYELRSLQKAIQRLFYGGYIERAPRAGRGVYRRRRGAFPPMDRRGHGNGGRKPKHKKGG